MTKRKSVPKEKPAAITRAISKTTERPKSQPTSRINSKQLKVIGMLNQPTGSTIPAIMKATGWQQQSVRGFFAGVVRKKLKLNLESEKPDGHDRTYRIIRTKSRKAIPKGGQSSHPVG